MKKTFRYSLLLAGIASFMTFGLAACSGKTLDYRNSEVVNGALYAKGANQPFTGMATNLPNTLVLDKPAFMVFSDTTAQALVTSLTLASPPTSRDAIINRLGGVIRQASLGGFPSDADDVTVFCDAPFTDGVPDGKVQCKSAQMESVVLEATFAEGKLDGKLTSYTFDGGKQNALVTATFRNGLPDGEEDIYSPSTHRVVHTLTWSSGMLSGIEEVLDENDGSKLQESSNLNGKTDGDFTRWAPGGKQVIDKGTYANGAPDGLEEGFDPDTGGKIVEFHWSSGKLTGEAKKWDPQGNLVALKTYENGFLATTSDEQETRFAYGQDPNHPAVYVPLPTAAKPSTAARADSAQPAQTAAPANTPPAPGQSASQPGNTVVAGNPASDGPTVKRCGWIENNLPSSLTLKDRNGTWDLTNAEGIDSAPATDKGQSCGCLTVVSDKTTMHVLKVSGGKLSPLSACQGDATLN
jgi:antitoxin component YwqK of YwqJK toxin-antitoxin module